MKTFKEFCNTNNFCSSNTATQVKLILGFFAEVRFTLVIIAHVLNALNELQVSLLQMTLHRGLLKEERLRSEQEQTRSDARVSAVMDITLLNTFELPSTLLNF